MSEQCGFLVALVNGVDPKHCELEKDHQGNCSYTFPFERYFNVKLKLDSRADELFEALKALVAATEKSDNPCDMGVDRDHPAMKVARQLLEELTPPVCIHDSTKLRSECLVCTSLYAPIDPTIYLDRLK